MEGSWFIPFFVLLFVAALVLPTIFLSHVGRRPFKRIRKHLRREICTNASFAIGERDVFVDVSNISVGGMRFQSDEELACGHVVNVRILSPDCSEVIEALGKIVWCNSQLGYGLQFQDLDFLRAERIRNWISRDNLAVG